MTSDRPSLTRRDVLRAGAAAVPLALVGPGFATRTRRNDTLQLGCIGTGRMGRGDLRSLLLRGLEPDLNARIVAVCDVDRRRAQAAKQLAESLYAKRLPDGPVPDIAVHHDFRELLARPDLDGVSISTPDFWHAEIAVRAARARKDLYVQKPLTYTIREGQALVAAVREHGVVLQVGSQQRSDPRFRRACELVRNGRIGKLERVVVHLPPDRGRAEDRPEDPPEELDYDFWMGPTAPRPYVEQGVHPRRGFGRPGWLQREGYCRGMVTGWGSHMNDIAQWGHGSDRSGLVEIEASAEFPDRGLFDVHTKFRAEGRWADGVVLVQETGTPAGVHFFGSEGRIFVRRGGLRATPKEILEEPLGEADERLYASDDHYRDFLRCMRTRRDPAAPVEVGHRSNSLCVITHLAMKLGRRLRWDPQAERFVDDDEANARLARRRRDPWRL